MLISILSACRLLAPQENVVLPVNWDQHFTAYIRELEIYRYNSAAGGLSDAIHQDNRMAGIQFNLPYSMQNTSEIYSQTSENVHIEVIKLITS